MPQRFDWNKLLISPESSIKEAVEIIDQNVRYQIAVVVDGDRRVLGTVTDGDVRRAILNRVSIDEPVSKVMKSTPLTAPETTDLNALYKMMSQRSLRQIVLLGADGRFSSLRTLQETQAGIRRDNPVCLMAGGLGTRLYPLTRDIPKPLIKVGDTPILEIILQNFVMQGFRDFYISVNYKSELIKEHFGDGRRWGCEIRYLHEDKRLGTAGALSLIEEKLSHAIIVKNGDLLTRVDFGSFVDFHQETGAKATMGVREHTVDIPFGVVEMDGHRLKAIVEKPKKKFFINAGMYVLDPEVVSHIPKDVYYDMPTLFQSLDQNGENTSAFPIREYWLDIGAHDQLERAQQDYDVHFAELMQAKA